MCERPYNFRKVLLFCRYHFAMGGWRGLGVAAGRRLKRLQHRQVLERPAPESQASIVPDLQQPPLALETCTDPALTIVIPCYGQHEVTAQCLQSIASFPPSVPYEVLVADDVADTGATLHFVRKLLPADADVRVAVLYSKPATTYLPELAWRSTDKWIRFPWIQVPPLRVELVGRSSV